MGRNTTSSHMKDISILAKGILSVKNESLINQQRQVSNRNMVEQMNLFS